jgi:hypothetical protein
MLGYTQEVRKIQTYNADEDTGRERFNASPKEQITKVMNLSGKKTRIGRISGESRLVAGHQRGKPENVPVNFQVPGQRTHLPRGSLSFFNGKMREESEWVKN